jgi:hypothetical protein
MQGKLSFYGNNEDGDASSATGATILFAMAGDRYFRNLLSAHLVGYRIIEERRLQSNDC